MSKCVMLENGDELNYQTRMRRCFTEVQLHQQRINNLDKLFDDGEEDASAGNKTMQMLKCLMTMKRKVKRMRERRTSATDADTENDDEDE